MITKFTLKQATLIAALGTTICVLLPYLPPAFGRRHIIVQLSRTSLVQQCMVYSMLWHPYGLMGDPCFRYHS